MLNGYDPEDPAGVHTPIYFALKKVEVDTNGVETVTYIHIDEMASGVNIKIIDFRYRLYKDVVNAVMKIDPATSWTYVILRSIDGPELPYEEIRSQVKKWD